MSGGLLTLCAFLAFISPMSAGHRLSEWTDGWGNAAGAPADPPDGAEWVWSTEVVDSGGDCGEYCSLELDSAGNPAISYYNRASGGLMFAQRDAGGWNVQGVLSENDVGMHSSLALDRNDVPHISFYDATTHSLMYSTMGDGAWVHESVDGGEDSQVGTYTSIAVDSTGQPHISYYNDVFSCECMSHNLRYASRSDTGWLVDHVDGIGLVGKYTSLALDGSDRPHISYQDWGNGHLRYATCGEEGWEYQTLDRYAETGLYTSLALDSEGRPHIAYHDGANTTLRYMMWDGHVWRYEVIDEEGDVGAFCSLGLDGRDRPVIACQDGTAGHLMVAAGDGADWVAGSPDGVGEAMHSSLEVDAHGRVHVAFHDPDARSLLYTGLTMGHSEDVDGNGGPNGHLPIPPDDDGEENDPKTPALSSILSDPGLMGALVIPATICAIATIVIIANRARRRGEVENRKKRGDR